MSDTAAARQRALGFLLSESEGLPRVCARVVADGHGVDEVLAELAARESRAAEPDQCLQILGVLDAIGALGSELAQQVCARATGSQRPDGSWRAAGSTSEDSEIFHTGMIAGFLAKTPFVRQRTLDASADRLAGGFAPERVKGDAWEVTAAYFHCFSLVRHESADAILQWCGRELQRGFVTGCYDAVRTARVFVWCRAHALPGATLRREDLVERLVAEQCEDGGYRRGDRDGLPERIAHTFDALVSLAYLS